MEALSEYRKRKSRAFDVWLQERVGGPRNDDALVDELLSMDLETQDRLFHGYALTVDSGFRRRGQMGMHIRRARARMRLERKLEQAAKEAKDQAKRDREKSETRPPADEGAGTSTEDAPPVPTLDPASETPPAPAAHTPTPPVVLQGRGKPVLVRGKPKPALRKAQYDVVETVIGAGEDGLGKDDLEVQSRHSDARRILKRLADSDRDWASVIFFPGLHGQGLKYRILR